MLALNRSATLATWPFRNAPWHFRAGQFVDNSADNLTLQCRDYDTSRYTVTLTLGLWQQITSLRLVPKVITVTMIRVIHPHHNSNRRWRASVSNLRWKMTDWKRYWVTDAGPNRRHKLSLTDTDCVSVKFGGRNISIATLLFPRRLQLSCTRKLTGNIYPRCSLFLPRHFRYFAVIVHIIHPHHNSNRRWRASVSNLRWKMTDWKRYWVTDAGPNRRHKLSLTDTDCVSVKFGGRNISIATLLFPRRLQLSCTRKLTGNIYPRCSLFLPRHFRYFAVIVHMRKSIPERR